MKNMINILITIAIIGYSMNLRISHTNDEHLSYQEKQIIVTALNTDPFFRNLDSEKQLGAGTYGVVLKMKKNNASGDLYALKIGTDDRLTALKETADESQLWADAKELSDFANTLKVTEFLEEKNIPYLSKALTNRQILSQDPTDARKPLIKNVNVFELADYGDFEAFAKGIEGQSQQQKHDTYVRLFYKTVLSVYQINKKGMIHGDIKPKNIFVKSCNDLGSKICPVVGDWDLGYYLNGQPSVPSQLRYTAYYRPPEMWFFIDNAGSSLLTGPTGYKYNGKEDGFALAISFLEFAFRLNIELDADIINILVEMAYPLTAQQMSKLATIGKNRLIGIPLIVQGLKTNHVDANYKQKVRRLDELSTMIAKSVINNRDLNDSLKNLSKGKSEPGYTVYTYVRRYLNQMKNVQNVLVAQIGQENTNEFHNLIDELNTINPFKTMTDQRLRLGAVLNRLYKKLHPEANEDNVGQLMREDIDTVAEIYDQPIPKSPIDKQVLVMPSFFNIPLRNMKIICEDYDVLTNTYAGPYEQEVDFNASEPKSYRIIDFCPQIMASTGNPKGITNSLFDNISTTNNYINRNQFGGAAAQNKNKPPLAINLQGYKQDNKPKFIEESKSAAYNQVKGINPTAKLINDMGINFSQKPNQNYQVIQSNQAQMITKPPSQNKYQRSSTHHQGVVVNRVSQQPTINNGLNINRRPPSGKSVNPQIRNSVNVRKSVNTRPTINQANYGMNNIIKKRILLI